MSEGGGEPPTPASDRPLKYNQQQTPNDCLVDIPFSEVVDRSVNSLMIQTQQRGRAQSPMFVNNEKDNKYEPEVSQEESCQCCIPLDKVPRLPHSNEFYSDLAANSKALPYTPIRREKDLPMFRKNVFDKHLIGGLPSQLHKEAWLAELEYENDSYLKSYILSGITKGFPIVDDVDCVPSYDNLNYSSVYSAEAGQFIDDLIVSEVKEGKYIVSSVKPKCIHSLGVVPKAGGGFRPITDCSRPTGLSINNHMNTTALEFAYHTVDYISELMEPDDFSATVDIATAYRSVSILPEHRTCQGIRWKLNDEDCFLLDTRLCFGISSAPYIFSQLSNFVIRAMHRRGFVKIANYLDDYIIFAPTVERCQYIQSVLIHLLATLGFMTSWKKCSSPAKCTRYLGILFDSRKMELRLPDDKLCKLQHELSFFRNKTRASKKQIQKLVGYLAHCAKVVRGGRLFSRRIISLLRGLGDNKRIRLPDSFRLDLQWWQSFMQVFNGAASIIRYNFGTGPMVWTDACMTGYGVYCLFDWQAGSFDNSQILKDFDDCHNHWVNIEKPCIRDRDDNVNLWELIAAWQAVCRLAHRCVNQHLVIATDNTQVVAMINGSTSVNMSCLSLLREIFWMSAIYNVYITARYLPGSENIFADRLSRLSSETATFDIHNMCLCCSV